MHKMKVKKYSVLRYIVAILPFSSRLFINFLFLRKWKWVVRGTYQTPSAKGPGGFSSSPSEFGRKFCRRYFFFSRVWSRFSERDRRSGIDLAPQTQSQRGERKHIPYFCVWYNLKSDVRRKRKVCFGRSRKMNDGFFPPISRLIVQLSFVSDSSRMDRPHFDIWTPFGNSRVFPNCWRGSDRI